MRKRSIRNIFIINLLFIITLQSFRMNNLSAMDPAAGNTMAMNTLHFRIFYQEDMTDLAVHAAKMSEDSYVYLADYFKHELTDTVQIYLDDGLKKNPGWNIPGDFSEYSTGNIKIAFDGDYSSFHKNITRGLAQVFQYNIIYGSTGHGIYYNGLDSTEFILKAMAGYISEGYSENAEMVMRDIIIAGKYISLMDIKSTGLSDMIGKSFFYFLESAYGADIIADMLFNIKYYSNVYKAIEKTLGKKITDINGEWAAFYIERNKAWMNTELKSRSGIITPKDSIPGNIALEMHRKFSFKNESTRHFNDMAGFDNYPGFTADYKITACNNEDETREILIIDTATGKILKKIKFPFLRIKDVCISGDGKTLVFTGCTYSSSDIYTCDIEKNTINRITHDGFSKRFPRISSANDFIVFSSNENSEKNMESGIYKLVKIDLKSHEKTILLDNRKTNIHPDISPDNKKILYISNLSGIYNLYLLDIETKQNIQLTDVSSGAFFPRWVRDGEIVYTVYNDSGYKIFLKAINEKETIIERNTGDSAYKEIKYPQSYFEINDAVISSPEDEGDTDISFTGAGAFRDNGFTGSIRITAGGFPDNYRLKFNADYPGYDYKIKNDAGFNLDYEYLKYMIDFGSGLFYRSNPLQSLVSDYTGESIILYSENINSTCYGISVFAQYPFTGDFFLKTKLAYEVLENVDKINHDDVHSNLFSLSLAYDSIGDNPLPSGGAKSNLSFGHFFGPGNGGISVSSLTFDFIKYFRFNRIIFSIKGGAGKISGKDDGYFNYYPGGFNSIRGHGYFDFSGNNAFIFSTELRFIIADRFKAFSSMDFNDISLVLFSDLGSAWDKNYSLKNDNGEFEDLKSGMGTGLRFITSGHILFKLDVAWPYYYKSFGEREITAGFELRY